MESEGSAIVLPLAHRAIESNIMVIITFRNKKYEVKENMTARDALKRLNIDPESVLITVNGKLVTDDIVLREGDEVKLVAVISGGN